MGLLDQATRRTPPFADRRRGQLGTIVYFPPVVIELLHSNDTPQSESQSLLTWLQQRNPHINGAFSTSTCQKTLLRYNIV